MDEFRARFKEETYFKKPQGREWDISALKTFVKTTLPTLGGVVTKNTGIREWNRIIEKYENIIFEFINQLMSKGRDSALTNSMVAAMGSGSGERSTMLGEGYMFWCKDRTGDDPSPDMQARFEAMAQEQQECCDWLQSFSREAHLYYVDQIIDEKLRSSLVAEIAQLKADGTKFEWSHAKLVITRQLRDFDVKFLTDAVASMLRDDESTLLEWVQIFRRLHKLCTKAGVTYPPSHWCKQLLGQVSKKERTSGKFFGAPRRVWARLF